MRRSVSSPASATGRPGVRAPALTGPTSRRARLVGAALLGALALPGLARAQPAPCAAPSPPAPAASAAAPALAASAATGAAFSCSDGRVSCDRWSGVAIGGFDPVAPRIEGAARPGQAGCAAVLGGVAWLFASAANREAFLDAPALYEPAFGGYDARGAARGVAIPADPTIWLVPASGPGAGRLHLFRSEEDRDAFAADEALVAEAIRRWPAILRSLTP